MRASRENFFFIVHSCTLVTMTIDIVLFSQEYVCTEIIAFCVQVGDIDKCFDDVLPASLRNIYRGAPFAKFYFYKMHNKLLHRSTGE